MVELDALAVRNAVDLARQVDDSRNRNLAFEIAAEGRHDRSALDLVALRPVALHQHLLRGELLGVGAILIALEERLRAAKDDGAFDVEACGRDRALESTIVQPQTGIDHPRLWRD